MWRAGSRADEVGVERPGEWVGGGVGKKHRKINRKVQLLDCYRFLYVYVFVL